MEVNTETNREYICVAICLAMYLCITTQTKTFLVYTVIIILKTINLALATKF